MGNNIAQYRKHPTSMPQTLHLAPDEYCGGLMIDLGNWAGSVSIDGSNWNWIWGSDFSISGSAVTDLTISGFPGSLSTTGVQILFTNNPLSKASVDSICNWAVGVYASLGNGLSSLTISGGHGPSVVPAAVIALTGTGGPPDVSSGTLAYASNDSSQVPTFGNEVWDTSQPYWSDGEHCYLVCGATTGWEVVALTPDSMTVVVAYLRDPNSAQPSQYANKAPDGHYSGQSGTDGNGNPYDYSGTSLVITGTCGAQSKGQFGCDFLVNRGVTVSAASAE